MDRRYDVIMHVILDVDDDIDGDPEHWVGLAIRELPRRIGPVSLSYLIMAGTADEDSIKDRIWQASPLAT